MESIPEEERRPPAESLKTVDHSIGNQPMFSVQIPGLVEGTPEVKVARPR